MNPLYEEPVPDDLRMMRTPSLWPNYPYQTIKNPSQKQENGFPRLAVLIATFGEGEKPIIRFKECNLWTITSYDDAFKGSIIANFEALIKEGWVID